MTDTPPALPLTKPDALTEADIVLLLLQVPPLAPPLMASWLVVFAQMVVVPVMVPGLGTVQVPGAVITAEDSVLLVLASESQEQRVLMVWAALW